MSKEGLHYYCLDENGEPKPAGDLMTWANSNEKDYHGKHSIGHVVVGNGSAAVMVSTIFLPIVHVYGEGTPVHWETAAIGPGVACEILERCGGTREQAEAMHAKWVAEITRKLSPPTINAGGDPEQHED